MDKMNFMGLRIALDVGGTLARGMLATGEVEDAIRAEMAQQDMDDDAFESIEAFVYVLLGFANDIRAAERKKLPIVRMVGEKLPD